MPRATIIRFLGLLIGLLAGLAPALAHRPYVTRSEPIVLPDGRAGEMRMLHGDGIFLADPVRLIVVDDSGRLVARSRRAVPMSMSCQNKVCIGYDHSRDQVLELDAGTFRPDGPIVSPSRDDLWEIEDGESHWGFKARSAGFWDQAAAELALARSVAGPLLVLCFIGAVAMAFLRLMRTPFVRPAPSFWAKSVQIIVALGGVAVAFALLMFALYLAALMGLSVVTWFVGLAGGAVALQFAIMLKRTIAKHFWSGRASPV